MEYSFDEMRDAVEVFHSGDSARAFNYFGAHLVNCDGTDGVMLRVWAPNAMEVSVVGEFNNWNETACPMKKTEGGVWELFTPTMKELDVYKYHIVTADGEKLLKADPFAFYAELRPKNASRVFDLEKYKWNDSEWMEQRAKTDYLKRPVNIYEIHAASWKHSEGGGFMSYQELADELADYLLDMGYTHVQLMPIMEHPYDPSWGYQTTGYFAATSRFGTPDGLMYFVDRMHRAGIGVVVDWVPSNFPKDDFALSKFDGTSLYEDEDPKLGERASWGTCLFNFASREVLSFLISSAVFWLGKYHMDGIRVGALSSMLYLDYGKKNGEWTPNRFGGKENLEAIDFVKRLNTAVHMFCPGALMFAEEHTSWSKITHRVEEGGLGFDYKWNMGWLKDMANYMTLNPLWRPFNHDNLTYSFFYAFSEQYLLPMSHDESANGNGSIISKMPGDDFSKFAGMRAFITYMYAHPGKKLVFMGNELGQFDEWDFDAQLQWELINSERNRQLKEFFKTLNRFYLTATPFFERDANWKGFDWIHHDDYTNSVIAFKRTDESGNEIIAVCNFLPVKHDNYMVGVPQYAFYDEVFNSDSAQFGGSGITNGIAIKPEKTKIHGCNQGLSLTLPPMSVIYLRRGGEIS